ncbi:hypothetical protein EDB84DRAFT_1438400 [Lactarius hengduanensis]|nr:hypothetical protein EDB84DRAFT_1438400 [Lactarius hengduanensis]
MKTYYVIGVTAPRQSGENSGPDSHPVPWPSKLAPGSLKARSSMSSAPSWKKFFAEGIKHFRRKDIDEAIKSFNKAISLANDKSYVLYDSRASAYEKKNLPEDALRDAKKTIDIAPKQWHGYFRSARLFAVPWPNQCCVGDVFIGTGAPQWWPKARSLSARAHQPVSASGSTNQMPGLGNPIVISHVCHQWREIALSQPTLWRSLVLAAPAKKAFRKVQEWYKRSCGRIEELVILLNHRNPDDRAKYPELLARLRQLDLTQLKECHMEEVNAESFFSALSDNTRYDHQHSETLSISYMDPRQNIIGRPEYAELPWENLRAFSIVNGGVFGRFHEFLQANPGLEKLVVEAGLIYPHQIPEAPASLTLAHLRHLELIGDIPFRIKRGNFSLPSLQILRMIKLRNGEVTLAELVEDEETSFAELVEFTARGCFLESQTLTSVLFQAPKLEILSCTGSAVNVLAESLTKPCMALLKDQASEVPTLVPTKLPILCPALSVLDLSQSDVKTDPIMRMVKDRIALAGSHDGGRYQLPGENGDRGVSCIWSLNVDGCSRIEAEMLPWFRENVPMFSCHRHYTLRGRR